MRKPKIILDKQRCKDCKVIKLIEEFDLCYSGKLKEKYPNSQLRRTDCKDCRKKYQKTRTSKPNFYKDQYASMSEEKRQEYIQKKSKQNSLRPNIKEIRKTYSDSDKGIFKRYINECKRRGRLKRGIRMLLSLEEFSKLINSNCKYCDKENCRGVDRIDSSGSYTLENSAPCCSICNTIKTDLSVLEFEEHIRKIISNLDNKKQR